MRKKSHACVIRFLYGTDLKIEMWNLKYVGDIFEIILIEKMKETHKFMYVCDTGERKKIHMSVEDR
jgi:hypothetical protein